MISFDQSPQKIFIHEETITPRKENSLSQNLAKILTENCCFLKK